MYINGFAMELFFKKIHGWKNFSIAAPVFPVLRLVFLPYDSVSEIYNVLKKNFIKKSMENP